MANIPEESWQLTMAANSHIIASGGGTHPLAVDLLAVEVAGRLESPFANGPEITYYLACHIQPPIIRLNFLFVVIGL
jgi:hypothetical protein